MENLSVIIESLRLKEGVKELAEKLNRDQSGNAYSTSAGMLLLDNNEEVQVQIVVTRNKEDFYGDFDVVRLINFN